MRIVSSVFLVLALAGCGTPMGPTVLQSHGAALSASSAGTLVNRALPPLKGIAEADYRAVDDEAADKLLAGDPATLKAFLGEKVKFEGERFDWDRRWYRTGPRDIYLTRGGKRYTVDSLHGYLVWSDAIGKPVTAFVEIVPPRASRKEPTLYLAAVKYR